VSSTEAIINQIINDIVVEQYPTKWLATQGINGRPVIADKSTRNPNWTQEEDEWLRENLPILGVIDCAKYLGRTVYSVKVYATRHGFIFPRNAIGYLSCRKIADILGVDNHKPYTWVDIGLLAGESLPYDDIRLKRRVKILDFKLWLIQPMSWVYFDVRKMQDSYYRRLVELAQQRWGDEWWTTRQAADYLGCDTKTILHNIQRGRIYGYHAIGLGRRRQQRWAYWFVRRSEIEHFSPPRREDSKLKFTPAADDFMLRARIEWGYTPAVIAKLIKYPGSYRSIDSRIRMLCRQRGIALPSLKGRTNHL